MRQIKREGRERGTEREGGGERKRVWDWIVAGREGGGGGTADRRAGRRNKRNRQCQPRQQRRQAHHASKGGPFAVVRGCWVEASRCHPGQRLGGPTCVLIVLDVVLAEDDTAVRLGGGIKAPTHGLVAVPDSDK